MHDSITAEVDSERRCQSFALRRRATELGGLRQQAAVGQMTAARRVAVL